MQVLLTLFCFLFFGTCLGQYQVVDGAPSGRQDILPVEGGGIRMKIDTVTPLSALVLRLDSEWRFNQTGKGYWIGYTNDMFSIAAHGDPAIDLLLPLFNNAKTRNGKIGAIYSLHLLGIDRCIVGRFVEKFTNPNARKALLEILAQSDFTFMVSKLLIRDPWKSDVPILMELLNKRPFDESHWPVINALTRYGIEGLPISNHVPHGLENLQIQMVKNGNFIFKANSQFDEQVKLVLNGFKQAYPTTVFIENGLLESNLFPNYENHMENAITLDQILSRIDLDVWSPFKYMDLGYKIQYYCEENRIYFCSVSTARDRIVTWWNNLPETARRSFK